MQIILRSEEGAPLLSQSNYMGYSVDIFGKFQVEDIIKWPLFDPGKSGLKTVELLGKKVAIPKYVNLTIIPNTSVLKGTSTTREEFQDSLSVNAKVKASIGSFSAQSEVAYSKSIAESSEYFFSFYLLSAGLAVINLLPDLDCLEDYFIKRVNELPDKYTQKNRTKFIDFFEDYGIYFVSKLYLGGTLQYYASVLKSSTLSTEDISVMVSAEYNALFVSGQVSTEVETKDEWSKYKESKNVNIICRGGDPTLVSKISTVEPNSPGDDTVNLFSDWTESLKENPSISRFELEPIWNLCGDKKDGLKAAFDDFEKIFRPRIFLQSTGGVYAQSMVIIVDEQIIPDKAPEGNAGFQVIAIDRQDISKSGIKMNQYFSTQISEDRSGWNEKIKELFDSIELAINENDLRNPKHILLFNSFGLPRTAIPTPGIHTLWRSCGAGDGLANWDFVRGSGSTWKGAYSLIGIPGLGPNTGVDYYTYQDGKGSAADSEVVAFFYIDSTTGIYSLGAGSRGGI